ncbi:hypothetical protein [Endozoicomonas sp. SESOKO3]|uniref:hypothetical protein n=1 Tax=Endozoicomonas sp. SESOKO3 TaxID=2828744 RepID=UPI002147ACF7|nr:hypothetical protein [Endozoicomonas sp. SESOKO3]
MSHPSIGPGGNRSTSGLPADSTYQSPSPSGQDTLGRTIGSREDPSGTEGLHQESSAQGQRPIQDREVAYYKETGQVGRNILPSINDRPFSEYWEEFPGPIRRGVVDHRLMRVKTEARGIDKESDSPKTKKNQGLWHIKTLGYESGTEKFKRLLQKVIYLITGKPYKARFYDNRKVLAQRECLAAEAYKKVMHYGQEYMHRYSLDEKRQDHCVASKDLKGFYPGDTYFHKTLFPSICQFADDHNPVTNLVMRRFLLGDQDYLKLDNYLFKHAEGDELMNVEKGDELITGKLVSIDFGMSFYNQFSLPKNCTMDEFTQKLLQPSRLHRVQYRGKNTLLTMVEQMPDDQVKRSIESALQRIAELSDQHLSELAEHMHQPELREAMYEVLEFKRSQAKALLNQGSWPEELGVGKGFSVL